MKAKIVFKKIQVQMRKSRLYIGPLNFFEIILRLGLDVNRLKEREKS